jgi:hypothetical protein
MTEQMDRIWGEAKKDIQFRTDDDTGLIITTSYHGNGHFVLAMTTHGTPAVQTSLHLSREQMEKIAEMTATAVGGCLYIAAEDADSEMGMAELDIGPDGLYA